jgi:hypothetical protein
MRQQVYIQQHFRRGNADLALPVVVVTLPPLAIYDEIAATARRSSDPPSMPRCAVPLPGAFTALVEPRSNCGG